MKWNGTASAITAIAGIVALAFGAWFTVTGAIAGEAEKLNTRIDSVQLQAQVEDVDFAIYQVTHKMDVIEGRILNGEGYVNDATILKQLQRQLDVLLRRQSLVLQRIESTLK
jgi:hypothetical protein